MNVGLSWRRYLTYWALGLAATLLVMAVCLFVQSSSTAAGFGLPEGESARAILGLRLARVGTAALVGAALAAAGVLLQALLRNPLADPYVLGISTGSSVGVMLWLVSFAPVLALVEAGRMPAWTATLVTHGEMLPALVGALVTCIAVFALARASSANTLEPLTLLLVGVVFSAFNGALILLLNSIKPKNFNADITQFLIGYISDGTPRGAILVALAVFLAGWAFSILAAGQLNIATLSDTEATSLGVRLSRLRTWCFIAASVMTAAAIALARAIGFVGLICPHVCRLLFGPDHRQLIVTAPFCGAIFLMLADAVVQLSRPWFPGGLSVGVITALAGAPFFLVLLRHHRRGEAA